MQPSPEKEGCITCSGDLSNVCPFLLLTSYDMKYIFGYLWLAVLHLQFFHWWSNVRNRKKALMLCKHCSAVTKHISVINTVLITNLNQSNLKAAVKKINTILAKPCTISTTYSYNLHHA